MTGIISITFCGALHEGPLAYRLPNAGPLEATIHSMQSELTAKANGSSEMQRRWLTMQTELVALQVSKPRRG
jgi:hypothetical protein